MKIRILVKDKNFNPGTAGLAYHKSEQEFYPAQLQYQDIVMIYDDGNCEWDWTDVDIVFESEEQ